MNNCRCEALKAILVRQGQPSSGLKAELMARIADGERFGRLGNCPVDGCEGHLKVDPSCPDYVFCPGWYSKSRRTRGCNKCPGSFRRMAESNDVPRSQWDERDSLFIHLPPSQQARQNQKRRAELATSLRQSALADSMTATYARNNTASVGDLVTLKMSSSKRRYGSQPSIEGVVYHVNASSGYCKIAKAFGVVRRGTVGKEPETFSPTEDMAVRSADAPVSNGLLIKRVQVLTGQFNPNSEPFLHMKAIAKKQEKLMKDASRTLQANSRGMRQRQEEE